MRIVIDEKKTIDVTPELLAKIFYEMDNEQQRDFFEHVAKEFSSGGFDNQMYYVVSSGMSDDALEIMREIGKAAR